MDFCPRDATPLPPPFEATQFELAVGLSRRYRIMRRLGEGGMGTVFLAEQLNVGNRSVALKVLRRKLLEDPEFLQRFQDEASSTGRIRHQNVVTVYERGQTDDGSPYIAMEYLEGESLRQTLKRRGSLPLEATAEILQQAARGLNAAHKLGIIHRDLKPDNIFLTHDDEGQPLIKIVDFGIAKMRESTTHTMTGLAIGTPTYMSVEQAAGMRSEEMDGRSDIYSLGIVVYEMITGRLPFQADTPMAYIGKHLIEPPPPFRATRPDLEISPKVEEVVMKALKKNREERYPTAPEFAREFSKAISTTSAVADEAREPRLAEPVPTRLKVVAPRNVWPIWAAAAIFVVAMAAVAWYALRTKTQTGPVEQHRETAATANPEVRKQTPTPPPPPMTQQPVPSQSPTKSAPEVASKIKAAMALGDLLYNRGEYDDAMAEYRKGLDAAPNNATLQTRIERAQKARAAEQRVSQ